MKTEASQNLWKRVLLMVGHCSEGSAEGSLFVLKFLASSLLLDMCLQFQILSQILLNHVDKKKKNHYQLLKKDGKELVVDLLLSMSLYGIRSRKVGVGSS